MPSENRERRAALAQETVSIVERGWYTINATERIDIGEMIATCLNGTRLFTPVDIERVVEKNRVRCNTAKFDTAISVTNETTLSAARRQIIDCEQPKTLCLNFASAKNPGGGFLRGSQAQEESLARSSALYASLLPQRAFYDANRTCATALYTNHMILSPAVPVFRGDDEYLLQHPYAVSILTSPAVNAGAVRANHPHDAPRIGPEMAHRIAGVLALAADTGYEHLVLGAWGCGVFRNDPTDIAEQFACELLDNGVFANRFRSIVFAVLDPSENEMFIGPFKRRFGG